MAPPSFPSLQLIGPLRCWPLGLCLSRSIGDVDVGEFIVPIPHVKQVKEAVQLKGLRDDTTCIVVDLLPPEKVSPFVFQPKKKGMKVLKKMSHKKSYASPSYLLVRNYAEPFAVEELFEDGSAVTLKCTFYMKHIAPSCRLNTVYPICNKFKLLICTVCQVEMKLDVGISSLTSSLKFGRVCLWEGQLLCLSYQFKKEVMEGKKTFKK